MSINKTLTVIVHLGAIVIAYSGSCPDGFKTARVKALKSEEGYSILEAPFAEYLEGDVASEWDFQKGIRLVPRPVLEITDQELWRRELDELKGRCLELDRASDRSMRAMLCKTETESDKAFLKGVEIDIQNKRIRIKELKDLLEL